MKAHESASVYSDAEERRAVLWIEAAGLTFKGMAVGGFVFFGPVLFVLAIHFVGQFLPPESKEAVDPTPDSFPIDG